MDTNGEGQFEFTMECTATLTNSNTTCGNVLLTDLDYLLVLDSTWASSGSPTFAELDALTFVTNTVTTVNAGANDADSNAVANGGFYTDNSAGGIQTGSGTSHSLFETGVGPRLLTLVIKHQPAGISRASYQYYTITITDLTQ